ncbi:MAG: YihY family inner membrane protein, partial [Candidatus Hydrogenedentes bacterium]|nr:YihY family inner membrane protein [Candidatus Hydrogenedentota bacterium]
MARYIQQAWEALARGRRFVTHDVWRVGRPGEEIPHGFIIKQVRVVILLVQSLVQDALLQRAAALTFATMLAAIPFLAIIFFVIQTLDLREEVPKLITSVMGDRAGENGGEGAEAGVAETGVPGPADDVELRQEIAQWLFQGVAQPDGDPDRKNPIQWLLDSAEKGADPKAIGIVGVIFVLTTVFGLMRNIESSFNAIWGVRPTRSWYRMFSDYMMVILLLPFLVVGVLSVTAVLESTAITERLGPFAPALRGTQYAVIWLTFTAMYFLVPNTRVRARYALFAGIVAGSLWCLLSAAYVKFQIGLSRYDLIYSGFALFPLLLMWIYSSWTIMLFGAELTFACQNEKTFAMERLAAGASHAYREALGIRAMIEIGRRFDLGLPGLAAAESAEAWGVPTRLLNDTLDVLDQAGLVRRSGTEPVTYHPARSVERITVRDVVLAIREAGRDPSALCDEPGLEPVLDEVNGKHSALMNASLSEITRKVYAAPEAPAGPPDDAERLG